MELDGKEELVVLRDFQMHPYKQQVMDEFRQITRQAGHFDVGGSTRDDALVDLNGRAELAFCLSSEDF